jgi:hypothetical protein
MTARLAARWSALAVVVHLACAWPCAPLRAQSGASESAAARGGALPDSGDARAHDDVPATAQAEYRDVVARAVAEFSAGRWEEARSLFLRAHALWPSARTFRSLGMTSFELRTYGRALAELQAALDDTRRPLSEEQRAQVAALIEQTRAFVGRYRVHLSPEHAVLLVDGVARELQSDGRLLLGVGRHELIARADRHTELRRTLDVQGNEDEAITLSLRPIPVLPSPLPSPAVAMPAHVHGSKAAAEDGTRVWTWVAGGAALALGAASAVLWFESKAEFDALAEKCKIERCVRGELDTSKVELAQTAHQITLGLAVGAGVGAVVAFFLEGGREQPDSDGVSVGLGTLDVRGHF